jgi:hypothetical protein
LHPSHIANKVSFKAMRKILAAGAVFAAGISGVVGSTSEALCGGSAQQLGGNYYCKAVKAITYTHVGHPGSYNEVTMMDPTTGQCASTPTKFHGHLAPLCDEVSAFGFLLRACIAANVSRV